MNQGPKGKRTQAVCVRVKTPRRRCERPEGTCISRDRAQGARKSKRSQATCGWKSRGTKTGGLPKGEAPLGEQGPEQPGFWRVEAPWRQSGQLSRGVLITDVNTGLEGPEGAPVRAASQGGHGGKMADTGWAGYAVRRRRYAWDGSRRLGCRGGGRCERAWSTSVIRGARWWSG